MGSAGEVMFVLQLILSLGPLAVYFLGLGLVNSQAHPCVIRAGADFVLLAVAFVPVIVAPVVALVSHGHLWFAVCVIALVGLLFWAMLPRGRTAWVVYNIDTEQCRRLLQWTARRLGWSTVVRDERLHVPALGLVVEQDALPWLRNVTLRFHLDAPDAQAHADAFVQALSGEIERVSMLPSPTGASLVIIGASLLGVPMWYVFQNFNAIVDVVRSILFA